MGSGDYRMLGNILNLSFEMQLLAHLVMSQAKESNEKQAKLFKLFSVIFSLFVFIYVSEISRTIPYYISDICIIYIYCSASLKKNQ